MSSVNKSLFPIQIVDNKVQFSPKAKWLIVAFVVGDVVGVVFISLTYFGFFGAFGPIGNLAFILCMSGGGALTLGSSLGIISTALLYHRRKNEALKEFEGPVPSQTSISRVGPLSVMPNSIVNTQTLSNFSSKTLSIPVNNCPKILTAVSSTLKPTAQNEVLERWDSAEGTSRLQRSCAKENFWNLVRYYESQIGPTYCGIATSVIALNALSIEALESPVLGEYRMFTQEEFFTKSVSAIINQKVVNERGLVLEELTDILKIFPLKVFKYEAKDLSIEEVRKLIVSALKNPHQCVLALYLRSELNQEGSGHWSPLAAYDSESDSFLVLDVAKYKYPPMWINATAFIHSMQTENNVGKSRGFIIIDKDYCSK